MATQPKIPVVTQGMDREMKGPLPLEAWAQDVSQTPGPGEIPGALTADHQKVIDCVRQYYQEFGTAPPVRLVVRRTGFSLRCLHRLFPDGYATGVC